MLVAALALAALAFWRGHAWPKTVDPSLAREPAQNATTLAPFTEERQGRSYEITPRFHYKISGLVVESHDSFSIGDISHLAAKDFLNTADLCLVWGANAASSVLRKLSFRHGDWTCYVSSSDRESWSKFHMNQLSNNHLLPATDEIARAIATTHITDQVEIEGELVDYKNGGFTRHTSITRDDTGNGACEIIYVTSYRVIESSNERWFKIRNVGLGAALLAALSISVALFVLPFIRRD